MSTKLAIRDPIFRHDFLWPFEQRMNQLVNDFFKKDSQNAVFASKGYPPMNVEEFDGKYKVSFAVSGMTADDVDVQYHNGMLTVAGRVSDEYRSDEQGLIHRELRHSAFSRSVTMPEKLHGIDPEAVVKDGMLILTWDLPEDVVVDTPKKIAVKNG